MYQTSLQSVTAEVEQLLVEKFSARGRDLQQKVQHVGRRVPRRMREHLAYLVEADLRTRNPKRAHQYDPERVTTAQKAVLDYLRKIDRKAIRGYRILGTFTSVAVNLLIVVLLFAAAYAYLK